MSIFRNSRRRPSEWPSIASGTADDYGIRPKGSYLVDVDRNQLLPLTIASLQELSSLKINGKLISEYLGDRIEKRFLLAAIMSSAAPGGLWSKKQRGFAIGKYVALPALLNDHDILFGRLARAVYGIGVAAPSGGTSVPIKILLLNKRQLQLMSGSEFVDGNYELGLYKSVTLFGKKIQALGYFGKKATFYYQGMPLAFDNVPAQNRKFKSGVMNDYFAMLQNEFSLPNNYFRKLRSLYHKDPQSTRSIVANINQELEQRKMVRGRAQSTRKRPQLKSIL